MVNGPKPSVGYRKRDRKVWEEIFHAAPHSWRSAPPSPLMGECLEFLRTHGASRVLDLGSGFGRWTNFVAREAGCSVVGLDYALGGGLLASQLGCDISGSRFLAGEITKLPFAGAIFDGFIAVLILDNASWSDGRAAVSELGRVIRPDSPGFVVFNPWPMPASAEAGGNPTSSCTRYDYSDDQVRDELLAPWRLQKSWRDEHGFRAFEVLT